MVQWDSPEIKKITSLQLRKGLLDSDPFDNYRFKFIKKQIEFLNQEEINRLKIYN